MYFIIAIYSCKCTISILKKWISIYWFLQIKNGKFSLISLTVNQQLPLSCICKSIFFIGQHFRWKHWSDYQSRVSGGFWRMKMSVWSELRGAGKPNLNKRCLLALLTSCSRSKRLTVQSCQSAVKTVLEGQRIFFVQSEQKICFRVLAVCGPKQSQSSCSSAGSGHIL